MTGDNGKSIVYLGCDCIHIHYSLYILPEATLFSMEKRTYAGNPAEYSPTSTQLIETCELRTHECPVVADKRLRCRPKNEAHSVQIYGIGEATD